MSMEFLKNLFQKKTSIEGFCYLIEKGDLADIKKLLAQKKSLIFERTEEGVTALHVAVRHNKMEIAALLVESGADVLAKNAKGITPYQTACTLGNKKMAEYLKKHVK